jgi:hypothetical protein
MKRYLIHISIFASFVFTACEKPETPVVLPPKPDGVQLIEVPMSGNYDNMVFVNLLTGAQFNADMNSFDLMLESQPNSKMVMMNGGREVLVASTGGLDFGPVNLSELQWDWDRSSDSKDSIRLSKALLYNNDYDTVYVVDRGQRVSPDQRYFQIKFVSVDETKYVLEMANMSGENTRRYELLKDPSKEFVYFTYDNGGQRLNFEPDRNNWHLCFNRHRTAFFEFNPPLLYTVVGTYINRHMVDAGVDSSFVFSDIEYAHSQQIHFHNTIDFMGFEWKWPNFTATGVVYVSRTNWNFFIRERHSPHHMFKLRFIDFYNSSGIKGYPRFELKQIR